MSVREAGVAFRRGQSYVREVPKHEQCRVLRVRSILMNIVCKRCVSVRYGNTSRGLH
jgi:hypothetical protein